MNARPTDDLRVVRAKQADCMVSGAPEGWTPLPGTIVAVQRRWLVPEIDKWYGGDKKNDEDIFAGPISTDKGWQQTYYPVRSEWRDLPEAEG